MKIIAPVKRPADVMRLIRAGAGELFGSVYDKDWEETYGRAVEFNRRGSYGRRANLDGWKKLQAVLEQCQRAGVPFSLAVNALRFASPQYPDINRILRRYFDIGGRMIIISDPALIGIAREIRLDVTLSSCANCFSQECVQYYYNQGIRSFIFPRDVQISEIAEITEAFPDAAFEAFGMYAGCRMNDGCCLGIHSTEYGELCSYCDSGDWITERIDRFPLTDAEQMRLASCQMYFSSLLRNACGQCAVFRLNQLVSRIKVLERADSIERLERAVRLTSKNILTAQNSLDQESYLKNMIRPSGTDCNGRTDCYYPEERNEG